MQRKHGFTLVELLVVIGIIAVLISILLPALSKARQSAVNVACLSNLRQQGLAMQFFAQEHQGAVPTYDTYPYPEGIARYLTQPQPSHWGHRGQSQQAFSPPLQVFMCGEAVDYPPGTPVTPETFAPSDPYTHAVGVSSQQIHYGMGNWITYWYHEAFNVNKDMMIDMARFSDLAPYLGASAEYRYSMKLLSGKQIRDSSGNVVDQSRIGIASDTRTYISGITMPAFRHNRKCNVLRLDGSVVSVSALSPGIHSWIIIAE